MTLPYSHSETTLKTVTVAEPSTQTVLTSTPPGISEGSTTYRTVNFAGAQPVQYINSQVEGNVFAGAQLHPAQYINRQVEGNVIAGAQLQSVQYINSQVEGNVFAGAQLHPAQYINRQVEGNVIAGAQLQPVQYINSQVEGNVMYGGTRYMVPLQQQRPANSVVYLRQAPRVMQQVYYQNVQPVSVSSVDETDTHRQIVSVHSYFLLLLLCYICIHMLHI